MQPIFFPLAEIGGLILVEESTFRHYLWIEGSLARNDKYKKLLLNSLEEALTMLHDSLILKEKMFLTYFDFALNYNTPPITAIADLGCYEDKIKQNKNSREITKSKDILCIIRPTFRLAPIPRISEGKIIEPDIIIEPSDLACAVQAINLKNKFKNTIKITALTIGQGKSDDLLNYLISAGFDRAIRIEAKEFPSEAIISAKIINECIKNNLNPNLILCGQNSLSNSQSLMPALAAILKFNYFSDVNSVEINNNDEFNLNTKITGMETIVCEAKSCIEIDNKCHELFYTLENYIALRNKRIEVVHTKILTMETLISYERELTKISIKTDNKSSQEVAAAITLDIIGEKGKTNTNITFFDGNYENISSLYSLEEVVYIADISESKNILLEKLKISINYANKINKSVEVICIGYDFSKNETRELLGEVKTYGINKVYLLQIPDNIFYPATIAEYAGRFIGNSQRKYHTIISGDKNKVLIQTLGIYLCEMQKDNNPEFWQNVTNITDKVIELRTYDGKLKGILINKASAQKLISLSNNLETKNEFKTINDNKNFSVYLIKAEANSFNEKQIQKIYSDISRAKIPGLKDAEIIVDVGYGIKNNEGLALAEKLKATLEELGIIKVFIGATRKVTQDLKLLPISCQIGQTGVKVNPKLIITLGVSGAPQHLDYINKKAIIIAFNQDPEAAIITNSDHLVFPIIGDIFKTVPEFILKLYSEGV
ncbi:MAG: hypothetical protein HY934_01720 [Candidatus Firestonebacteria bacterium]|nr:hypothetical protein [Candidatus Firestonebacteria bacterium]